MTGPPAPARGRRGRRSRRIARRAAGSRVVPGAQRIAHQSRAEVRSRRSRCTRARGSACRASRSTGRRAAGTPSCAAAHAAWRRPRRSRRRPHAPQRRVQRRSVLGGIDDRPGEQRTARRVEAAGAGPREQQAQRVVVDALAGEVRVQRAGLQAVAGRPTGVVRQQRAQVRRAQAGGGAAQVVLDRAGRVGRGRPGRARVRRDRVGRGRIGRQRRGGRACGGGGCHVRKWRAAGALAADNGHMQAMLPQKLDEAVCYEMLRAARCAVRRPFLRRRVQHEDLLPAGLLPRAPLGARTAASSRPPRPPSIAVFDPACVAVPSSPRAMPASMRRCGLAQAAGRLIEEASLDQADARGAGGAHRRQRPAPAASLRRATSACRRTSMRARSACCSPSGC